MLIEKGSNPNPESIIEPFLAKPWSLLVSSRGWMWRPQIYLV